MADPPGWLKIGGCSLHIRPLNHSQSCCRTLVPRCLDPFGIGVENSAASPVEFVSSRGLHSVCWPATRPELSATFFSFLDLGTSSRHLKGAVLSRTCTSIGAQTCFSLHCHLWNWARKPDPHSPGLQLMTVSQRSRKIHFMQAFQSDGLASPGPI